MAKRSLPNSERRSFSLPAWGFSLLMHASVLAGFVALFRPPLDGATPETVRDAGIVLKQTSTGAERFVGEEDLTPENPAPAESTSVTAQPKNLPTLDDLPRIPRVTNPTGASAAGEAATGAQPSGKPPGGVPGFLGNKATVSVFGVEGTGTRFVYVFDRSVSMEGRPLSAAKQQLLQSLDSLDTVHQFQIIFFNHQPKAWDLTGGQQRIAFATDRNKKLAARFVSRITAGGGTYRRVALMNGLALSPDVLFFLTDIDDPMSDTDVAFAVRQALNSGTAINCIEFGASKKPTGRNFLVRLAEETYGGYAYVSTSELTRSLTRPGRQSPE